MRTWMPSLLAVAVVLVLTAPCAVPAQTPAGKPATDKPGADKPSPDKPSAQKPGVVVGDVVVVTATVEAVDKDKRTVTLKGPAGRMVTLKVDTAVKNFDQVQVGDTLKAEYIDSIAVFVRKSGAPPEAREVTAVGVAPRGKKPAGMVVDTTELVAKIEKIDYDKRLVTLKGPEGNVRTIKVDQRVKNLRQMKVGDELVIRHTEALAIAVTK